MSLLIPELCHYKRLHTQSNKDYLLRTPPTMIEAGGYFETELYGGVLGNKLNQIDDDIGYKILNIDNWTNDDKIKAIFAPLKLEPLLKNAPETNDNSPKSKTNKAYDGHEDKDEMLFCGRSYLNMDSWQEMLKITRDIT